MFDGQAMAKIYMSKLNIIGFGAPWTFLREGWCWCRERSFITSQKGTRLLDMFRKKMWEGSRLYGTGLTYYTLCKNYKTILPLKQVQISFTSRQKIEMAVFCQQQTKLQYSSVSLFFYLEQTPPITGFNFTKTLK